MNALSAAIQRDAKALLGLDINSSTGRVIEISSTYFRDDQQTLDSADGKVQTCARTLEIKDAAGTSVIATMRVDWTMTSITK